MKPGTDVCPGCGETVVAQYTPDPVAGEDGVFHCYRHLREHTRLRCGRCGRAICTRCAMIGPAGPRCPECGRNKVPLRARAVAHEARMSVRGLFSGPMRYVLLFVMVGLIMGFVNTCSGMFSRPSGPADDGQPGIEQEE
jgi:hypothetical protein